MNGQRNLYLWVYLSYGLFCIFAAGCPRTPPHLPEVSAEEQFVPPEMPADPVPLETTDVLASGEVTEPVPPPASTPVLPPPPQETNKTPEESVVPLKSGGSGQGQATNLNDAKRLFSSAKEKRRSGQYSAAFLETREGWSLVHESEDQQGQELAREMLEEMNSLAEQLAASRKSPPNKFKTLILK